MKFLGHIKLDGGQECRRFIFEAGDGLEGGSCPHEEAESAAIEAVWERSLIDLYWTMFDPDGFTDDEIAEMNGDKDEGGYVLNIRGGHGERLDRREFQTQDELLEFTGTVLGLKERMERQ